MNKTHIPGFYYDEEKKKYFRVQADHLVPPGAKYSKGNVKKEKRKAKKQKLERQQAERHQHTVKRNPILRHAITGGTALHREHGSNSGRSNLEQRDAALISQYRPDGVRLRLPGFSECPELFLTSATYMSSTQQMITSSCHAHTGVSTLHMCGWDWHKPVFQMPPGCGLAAFHSSIRSVSLATKGDTARVVACAHESPKQGQIFISPLPPPGSDPIFPYQAPGVYFKVPNENQHEIMASINQTTGFTAVSTGTGIYVLDENPTSCNFLPVSHKQNRLAIDWLTPNVLAYENDPAPQFRSVNLWDIRTAKGIASRFKIFHRLTGLLNPCQSSNHGDVNGHRLLVSTNYGIELYDTRMPSSRHRNDPPLLWLKHVHQGPQLSFTTNGQDLVAAVDRDNVVQIYSTRSGRKVSSLAMPRSNMSSSNSLESSDYEIPHSLDNLQWYDDEHVGSALQACRGNEIVRWTWGGSHYGRNEA